MRYRQTLTLTDGTPCVLRNADAQDAPAMLSLFLAVRAQTDNLRTYPDECTMGVDDERRFLEELSASEREIEIACVVDGAIVGSAGIEAIGTSDKLRHRAEFGVQVDQAWWGKGVGRALTEACIACARAAGYAQLELDVVSGNERACRLYERLGFVEYGRNPRGFRTRDGRWQELALMRLELDG